MYVLAAQLPDPPAAWLVLRVLQVLNAADPSLADLDDTPDHMGADLMASRHDAWEELCMSKVRWCGGHVVRLALPLAARQGCLSSAIQLWQTWSYAHYCSMINHDSSLSKQKLCFHGGFALQDSWGGPSFWACFVVVSNGPAL
jgi:hypothetical protein